jgi:hypothetical protein
MAVQPFALTLWVQPDKTRWIDYNMDQILDRASEMARLNSYGDWCDSLFDEATFYPLVLTKDGLEGAEVLPEGCQVKAIRKQFAANDENAKEKVLALELVMDDQSLTQRPVLTEAGIAWVSPRRQEPVAQLVPPAENIKQHYRCELCRRFSKDSGQRWLNEVTHAFKGEGQSKRMRHDIICLIGRNTDVQLPNNSDDWGTCFEHDRLVEQSFPGCDKFSKRVVWE